jgi:hypothetical protein
MGGLREVTMSLLATLDLMDEVDFADIKEKLLELLVTVGIGINRTDSADDLDVTHFHALATAYGKFIEEEMLSGDAAWKLYFRAYNREYKSVLEQEKDEEDFWNEIDFNDTLLPKDVILRIARACGKADAMGTKAWYAYCAERQELANGKC